jgi:hypothetical protein
VHVLGAPGGGGVIRTSQNVRTYLQHPEHASVITRGLCGSLWHLHVTSLCVRACASVSVCMSLLQGIDCPMNAAYMDAVIFYGGMSGPTTYHNAICVFEHSPSEC